MSKTREDYIDDMLNKEAIRELAIRYSTHMSARNFDQQASLFVEDGEVLLWGDNTPKSIGHKALASMFSAGSEQMGGSVIPLVHNHEIKLLGEDSASGNIFVEVRSLGDDMQIIATGTYYDDYTKVNDEWKFKRRSIRIYAGFDA